MIRDTHPTAVRVLSVSYVRMLRAVRMVGDTNPNCENVECEL